MADDYIKISAQNIALVHVFAQSKSLFSLNDEGLLTIDNDDKINRQKSLKYFKWNILQLTDGYAVADIQLHVRQLMVWQIR